MFRLPAPGSKGCGGGSNTGDLQKIPASPEHAGIFTFPEQAEPAPSPDLSDREAGEFTPYGKLLQNKNQTYDRIIVYLCYEVAAQVRKAQQPKETGIRP